VNTYPLSPTKKPTARIRSPLVCFLTALGWFLFASHCFHLNRIGSEWGGLAGIVGSGLGVRSFFQSLYYRHQLLRVRRLDKRYRDGAKSLANARFGDAKDCKHAKLFGKTGVVLGCVVDQSGIKQIIRDDGEKLILLLGQAGANKSTSVIIPSLLPTEIYGGIGHSTVVNDPAGEAYAVCKSALEAANYRVVAISPWADLMSKRLGVKVNDVGFDIWSDFDENTKSSEWESKVLDKSELFIADRPKDDGQSRFFKDAGRTVFQFFALYILAAGVKPTPAMMRQMVLEGEEFLTQRCQEVIEAETGVAALRERALSLLGTMTRAPEEFSGGLSECKRSLGPFFDSGPMGSHFTADGFNPCRLKDDQPTVVFVMYPTDKIRSHRRAVNVTFSHLIEQLATDPRIKQRVTFLIDECSSLGHLPNLATAVTEYRKFSQRYVLCFQQFSGQVERNLGPEILKELRGSASVMCGANIRDPDDLSMFSKYAGTTTVELTSKHDPNSDQTANIAEQSVTRSHRERPLMRTEDVRELPDNEILIVHSNLPIIRAIKTRYWLFPMWNSIASPNPYNKS